MKYLDLLEFCRLVVDTEVDETMLRNHHVLPDGPISKVWGRVYVAIRDSKDFNYRAYLHNIIDLPEDDQKNGSSSNKLH